jgi:hypothetical protein
MTLGMFLLSFQTFGSKKMCDHTSYVLLTDVHVMCLVRRKH